MHQVEDWAEVNRLFHGRRLAKAAVARRLGMGRNTVDLPLGLAGPPRYRRAPAGSQLDVGVQTSPVSPRGHLKWWQPPAARQANETVAAAGS